MIKSLKMVTPLILLILLAGSFGPAAALPVQAAVTPYLNLSVYSGRAGNLITALGGNFTPGDTVSVTLAGNPATVATGTVGKSGGFSSTPFRIPLKTPSGNLQITATSTSGQAASSNFYVQPLTPSLTVKAPANTPGTIIVVSGNGFAPNEIVAATLGTAGNIAKADSKGNFATSFSLPFVPPDTYTIQALGQDSGGLATTYFYLSGFFPGAAPSAYFLTPGQTLTFSGWNFAPNEKVAISAGTTTLTSVTTDKTGGFKNQGGILIPANAITGALSLSLIGEKSQAPVAMEVSVGKLTPQIYPSGYFLSPGSYIDFSGFGFAPKETINVYEGLNQSPVTSLVADKGGGFQKTGRFQLPFDFASSSRQITLTGQQSGVKARVTIGVGKYQPQLAPSAYFIKPGQTITVDGWNFAPGEKVDINLGGQMVTVVANKTGNVKAGPLAIPFGIETFTIQATGESTQASTAIDLAIGAYNPVVSASKYFLLPGEQVNFSGNGFAPSEPIAIQEQDATGAVINSGTTAADSKGGFKTQDWTIPFGSSQAQTFLFTGTDSKASFPVKITVGAFNPYLNADKYSGQPGTTVKVKGAGFGSREKIDVLLNGSAVATVSADLSGATPLVPITIPAATATEATITFVGQQSSAKSSLIFSVSPFNPQVSPSTYFTQPGSAISFTGYGFMPGEKVDYWQGETGAAIGTATADAKGNIKTAAYDLPFGLTKSVTFRFQGQTSQKPLSLTIALGNFQPAILLSSYYGLGGTQVKITGIGFGRAEKVSLNLDQIDLGQTQTNSNGAFSLSTSIPPGPAQDLTFKASGQQSGAIATAGFTRATAHTSLSLSSYSGKPGQTITLKGAGFAAGDTVTVTGNDGSLNLGTFTTDKNGNLAGKFPVPNLPGGTLTLIVSGKNTFDSKTLTFFVSAP